MFDVFDKIKLAADLEHGIQSLLKWHTKWLVRFNAPLFINAITDGGKCDVGIGRCMGILKYASHKLAIYQ